ncbi:MAG: hypothetical protein IH897_16710 [Planctomycetes bacterium]|nr:hypothetical protein [Planctomycetota bacterium]
MAPELQLHDSAELSPGLFAIRVTQLTEMYLPERGPWSREQQARLDAGRAAVADFKNAEGDDEFAEAIYAQRGFLGRLFPPEARQAFVDDPARFRDYWPALRIEAVRQVQELSFLKLLGELRRREPMARIGGSILLYRVNDDDLRGLTK